MKKVIPFTKEIPFKTMISEITDINLEHDLEVLGNTIEGNFIVSGKYKMTDASVIEEDFLHKLPFTIEMDDKYDLSDTGISINDFYFEIINEEILKVNIEVLIDGFKDKPLKPDISLDVEDIRKTLEVNDVDSELVSKDEILDLNHVEKVVDEIDDTSSNINVVSSEKIEVSPVINTVNQNVNPSVNQNPNINVNSIASVNHPTSVFNEVKEIKSPTNVNANVNVNANDIVKVSNVSKQDNSNIEILDTTSATNNISTVDNSVSSIFSSMSTDETFSTYHVYIVRENDTLDSILDRYKIGKEEVSNYNDLSDIKVGSKLIIPCTNNE